MLRYCWYGRLCLIVEFSWVVTDMRRKTRKTRISTSNKLNLRHVRGVATASATRLLGVRESVRFGGRDVLWKEDEEERRLFLATGEYSVENSMKEPGESAEYG